MRYVRALACDDLWDGDLTTVKIGRQDVLLARVGEHVYAYENRCPHLGAPLHQGALSGGILRCPFHDWSFDLATGRGVNPDGCHLKAVLLHCEDGDIYVACEEDAV